MNKLEELYTRVHNDPKIIATLPIEEVDLLLNDMGLDLTTFMEKELKFIHEMKAQWTSPKPTQLTQWLEDQFTEGWQTLAEIFNKPVSAFRGTVVIKRAKPINLADLTVVLIVEIKKSKNQQVNVVLRVVMEDDKSHLPEGIKLTVIPQSGERKEDITKPHCNFLEQEWSYDIGEQFQLILSLGDNQAIEHFTV